VDNMHTSGRIPSIKVNGTRKETERMKRSIDVIVLFHTSTMLPNTRSDHEFKKKLIGNDYVIIAYNESDQSFDMKTLKVGF
jgi:hypothetical protein